jgi:hypothetical protein
VISIHRHSTESDGMGILRSIRAQSGDLTRIMALLRGNSDDRIGISLSVGFFADNGGAINGGGT